MMRFTATASLALATVCAASGIANAQASASAGKNTAGPASDGPKPHLGSTVTATATHTGKNQKHEATASATGGEAKGKDIGTASASTEMPPPGPGTHPDHSASVKDQSASSDSKATYDVASGRVTSAARGHTSFAGGASNTIPAGSPTGGFAAGSSTNTSKTGTHTNASAGPGGQSVDCKNPHSTTAPLPSGTPTTSIKFCTTPAAAPTSPAPGSSATMRLCSRDLPVTGISNGGANLGAWVMNLNMTLKMRFPNTTTQLSIDLTNGCIVVTGPAPLSAAFSFWNPPYSHVETLP